MTKKIVWLLVLFVLLFTGCSRYDSSIHDETIILFEHKYRDYLNTNKEKPINIIKLDDKSEYGTYGKINKFIVTVYLKDKEDKYGRNELWDLIEGMSNELESKEIIGGGTSSEGIYSSVNVIIGEGRWMGNDVQR